MFLCFIDISEQLPLWFLILCITYNKVVVLYKGYYFSKLIPCSCDESQLHKWNIETLAKFVKKSFDKVSTFNIQESYEQ